MRARAEVRKIDTILFVLVELSFELKYRNNFFFTKINYLLIIMSFSSMISFKSSKFELCHLDKETV